MRRDPEPSTAIALGLAYTSSQGLLRGDDPLRDRMDHRPILDSGTASGRVLTRWIRCAGGPLVGSAHSQFLHRHRLRGHARYIVTALYRIGRNGFDSRRLHYESPAI